jgi:hypothetical protein
MNYRSTNLIALFTILLLFGLNLFQFVMNPHDNHKIRQITKVNGEIFDNFAKLTELTELNTGTMMSFTHYLDKHDPSKGQILGCPECGKFIPSTIPKSVFEVPPVELTEVEESLDQIFKDAGEVNHYISSLIFTALNHDVALRITLHKMQHPGESTDGLHEKIYKPLSEYGIDPSRSTTVEEL